MKLKLATAVFCAAALVEAQTPAPTPTTSVLANLIVKPGADRAEIMKILPDEVRATVKLYLDGKIQQWFSRSDGRGVVFLLNCGSAAEARAITDTLPLSKANLAAFDYTELGPLSPLRVLIAPPPAQAK